MTGYEKTLYKKDTKGKIRVWKVSTRNTFDYSTVNVSHGTFDGKKIQTSRKISIGKNINKSNETTHAEQAVAEAITEVNKKIDEGYTSDREQLDIENTIPKPMLAHNYTKFQNKIKFPVFAQPKIDGVRCIYYDGVLYSRNGKAFHSLSHIITELRETIRPNVTLDGELYSPSISFEKLVGLVKKQKSIKQCENEELKTVKFIVYDIVSKGISFEERYSKLKDLFNVYTFENASLCPTWTIDARNEIDTNLYKMIDNKYEGLMLRNSNSGYVNNRSYDLLKYKLFQDDEFEIVGFLQGDGTELGCVVWMCQTPNKQKFNVRPRGTREERQELFLKGPDYIGKMLTVRYQELTTNKVPRFPVGISIRDYE
jgi:ATP-dependent DNA ligase